ncbi:MAG TPA: hypothetical protein VHL53_22500 [Acidimicrobiia bacterium]|nr:hypothetical protein [Acidimicrobiia bacterium]
MAHDLALIGANPAALLWDGDRPVGFVSVWQVDWSPEGSGGAIVLARPGELRVLCDPPIVGRWLYENFVQHATELAHFELPARPTVEQAPVKIDLDLVVGLTATANDVSVRISGILERRRQLENGLRLGGVPWSRVHVYAPCRSARLEVARSVVPGAPRIADKNPLTSSAWLSAAEVWARV